MKRPDGHCGALSSATASSASGSARSCEVEAADVLVAGGLPAAARIRVAPALVFVAVDRVGLDRGADVGDRLLGEAAVASRRTSSIRAGRRSMDSVKTMPCTAAAAWSAASRSAIFVSSETANGSSSTGVSYVPWAGGRSSSTTGVAQGGGRGPRDPDGLAGDAIGLSGRQDVRAREAPRAVDEDADAEPFVLAGGDAFDAAGLDRDGLAEPSDDAHVGIPRAERRGRIEGAVGEFSHWAASLAERSRRRQSVGCPYPRAVPARLRGPRCAADGLDRQVEADPEHEERRRERRDVRTRPSAGVRGRPSMRPRARISASPIAGHHGRHAEPERDDEHEAERRPAGRDRPEQDQQRARRRDEPAGQAEHEQAAPGDGRVPAAGGGCG